MRLVRQVGIGFPNLFKHGAGKRKKKRSKTQLMRFVKLLGDMDDGRQKDACNSGRQKCCLRYGTVSKCMKAMWDCGLFR